MPRLRLFCLPYSGASAMVYARWRRKLPAWLDVHPLELPGRGARSAQPFATDAIELARRLAMEIRADLQRPYALFGHSLGGLLAFETAHALREMGVPAPLALFASGTSAPARRDFSDYAEPKSDPELIERLRSLRGTSEEVLANPELLSFALPILRADFLLCGGYRYSPRAPLRLPIHVLGGKQDDVSIEDLLAWQDETLGAFSLDMFEGHHFFIHDCEREVLLAVEEHARLHLYGPPASGLDSRRQALTSP